MADDGWVEADALSDRRGCDTAVARAGSNRLEGEASEPSDVRIAGQARMRIVHADTSALRRSCYALRYKVYCVENNFLDAENHQDEIESDEYDVHSVHVLLQHVSSGTFVGTARLVMPIAGE